MGKHRLGAHWIGIALLLPACASDDTRLARVWDALKQDQARPMPELREEPPANLPSPEGLRAASGELRTVPLKWEPLLSSEVGGYSVERALARDGHFERIAIVSGPTATTYLDRGSRAPGAPATAEADQLGDGVTYFYQVRAYDPSGRLAVIASPVVAATTAPLPGPPEGLRAYSNQPRQVPLSWRTSPDPHVIAYVIERSPSSRGPFEPLATVEGRHRTIHVDSALGDLRVFYYRVSCLNAADGRGQPSEPVRAVTKPEPLPPVGLAVVERRLGENRLAWEPNIESDLVEYRVLRVVDDQPAELVASLPPEETRARDTAVLARQSVSYSLVAVDRDGLESASSQPVDVLSEGYGLEAEAGPDEVRLSWNPRVDEGYHGALVLRARWFGEQELGFAEGGSFVDSDVTPGARHRYTVVLERPDGTRAPPSSPLNVSVPSE